MLKHPGGSGLWGGQAVKAKEASLATCIWEWRGFISHSVVGRTTKYLHRVQSSVWRLPNYWPPPPTPSSPSECVLPRTEGGGYTTHSPCGERGGQSIFRKTPHWIGLLQYNPSTCRTGRRQNQARKTSKGESPTPMLRGGEVKIS
jgi:hypothetical protein